MDSQSANHPRFLAADERKSLLSYSRQSKIKQYLHLWEAKRMPNFPPKKSQNTFGNHWPSPPTASPEAIPLSRTNCLGFPHFSPISGVMSWAIFNCWTRQGLQNLNQERSWKYTAWWSQIVLFWWLFHRFILEQDSDWSYQGIILQLKDRTKSQRTNLVTACFPSTAPILIRGYKRINLNTV